MRAAHHGGMTSSLADVTQVRRLLGLRIAVVGVVLCLAGVPLLGVLVLLAACVLVLRGGGELSDQGASRRVGEFR